MAELAWALNHLNEEVDDGELCLPVQRGRGTGVSERKGRARRADGRCRLDEVLLDLVLCQPAVATFSCPLRGLDPEKREWVSG